MIEIEHLTKEYASGHKAVDDITFTVQAGEIFGFLGPNGAGKTTTIKVLTTLLHPTSGTARVAGHDVVEDPFAVRMSFGYVGQQSGVDPALTVRENLVLQGRLYHLSPPRIEERISFLLGLFDLKEAGGWWVGALSGGMKRKLDIATALIHEPKLLFLDEPTLGLDPQSRSDLWSYIRRLNREQGVTLFLTSHYLDEVDQLAHRVGIIDQGKLQTIGTPDQLKDSLGADCIQLSFKKALTGPVFSFFQKQEIVKEMIPREQSGREVKEIRLYLQNGKSHLSRVLQWVDEQGLEAETVLLTRPSFDDVYLKYTGKSLIREINKEPEAASSWGWGKWGKQSGGKKWATSESGAWADKWKEGEKSAGAAPASERSAADPGADKKWSPDAQTEWKQGKWSPEEQKEWQKRNGASEWQKKSEEKPGAPGEWKGEGWGKKS